MVQSHMHSAHAIVKRNPSGFFEVDPTKFWGDEIDTFVLPQHCEQASFFLVLILFNHTAYIP